MAKVHVLPSPLAYNGHVLYTNSHREAQCVVLIRELLHAPPGTMWVEGAKIERLKPGEQDPVAPGTPIATFVNSAYPDWSGTGHAAIYIGQNEQGIEIMDQWVGKPAEKSGPFKGKVVVSPRWLYWSSGPTHGVNDPSIYSVVTW